jgi:hypothetical protein
MKYSLSTLLVTTLYAAACLSSSTASASYAAKGNVKSGSKGGAKGGGGGFRSYFPTKFELPSLEPPSFKLVMQRDPSDLTSVIPNANMV